MTAPHSGRKLTLVTFFQRLKSQNSSFDALMLIKSFKVKRIRALSKNTCHIQRFNNILPLRVDTEIHALNIKSY
jgi:hypothetical protein